MKLTMKSNLRWFIYVGGACFFFLFWLYWVFPTDALKSRVITEIENRSKGRYRVEVGDMDFSFLGSLTFKNFKMIELGGEQESVLLKTPKLKIGFSPAALLSKNFDGFSFYLKGSKGDLEGEYHQNGDVLAFRADFDDFSLGDIPWLSEQAKVGIHGTINGLCDIKLNRSDPTQNSGKVDLQLINLSLDSYSLSLDPNAPDAVIEIPGFQLSGKKDSFIKADIQKDELKLQGIQLQGGQVDLNLDGKVTLRGTHPRDYRLALQGTFKIDDKLYQKLSALQFVLEQQKNAEGVYSLAISGRLGKPTVRVGKFTLPI